MCQFDEWCEKPGERDSHKAVPIAVTPYRLIAAKVSFDWHRAYTLFSFRLKKAFRRNCSLNSRLFLPFDMFPSLSFAAS